MGSLTRPQVQVATEVAG